MDIQTILGLESDNTKRGYVEAWKQWEDFNPTLVESRKTALFFLMSLKRAGLSMGTIRSRYHALSSIYNKLVAFELAERNPFLKLSSVFPLRDKQQVRPTQSFTAQEVNELLASPDRRTWRGVRDRAIFAAIFGGGLRISEVHWLNVGDVVAIDHGASWRLQLRKTKAQEIQTQPLADLFAEAICELVSWRKSEGAEEDDPLFLSQQRSRMSIRALSRLFVSYSRRVGRRRAPHSGRATFATQLLDIGCSYEQVAIAMRHADSQMVHVYDKRRRDTLENVGARLTY